LEPEFFLADLGHFQHGSIASVAGAVARDNWSPPWQDHRVEHGVFLQALSVQDIAMRVGTSVLGGTAIGLERLWYHKAAGLKTNTLVALGAAIFGMIGENSQFLQNWSASQFSIGVITGVGFLGSGIMMQRADHVQGVNSAATIWVSAGVGLACGMGEYGVGLISLFAVIFVQFVHRWIESKVHQESGR
jgi:putative Mg2+ transporter-C (MgtC) family protein